MSANRLEMHNISLAFSGFQALNKVDFTLHGGSVHALTGANGAVGSSRIKKRQWCDRARASRICCFSASVQLSME
ncbi:TPA: hypothetical protein NPP44_004807, partial [Klebsiella pneumoniae]|nr:hypothetical protein [Klebsiella pneumoniae]